MELKVRIFRHVYICKKVDCVNGYHMFLVGKIETVD